LSTPASPDWRRSSPRAPRARAPAGAPAWRRTDGPAVARSASSRSPPSAAQRPAARRVRQPPSRAASAACRPSPGQRRAGRGTPRRVGPGSASSRLVAPAAAAQARVPTPPPRRVPRQIRHAELASSLVRPPGTGTPRAALRPDLSSSTELAGLVATSPITPFCPEASGDREGFVQPIAAPRAPPCALPPCPGRARRVPSGGPQAHVVDKCALLRAPPARCGRARPARRACLCAGRYTAIDSDNSG
jgi:hypothetical protein